MITLYFDLCILTRTNTKSKIFARRAKHQFLAILFLFSGFVFALFFTELVYRGHSFRPLRMFPWKQYHLDNMTFP